MRHYAIYRIWRVVNAGVSEASLNVFWLDTKLTQAGHMWVGKGWKLHKPHSSWATKEDRFRNLAHVGGEKERALTSSPSFGGRKKRVSLTTPYAAH